MRLAWRVMTQEPLNARGGEAKRFQLRMPDELLSRVTALVERQRADDQDTSVAAFMRRSTEAELQRIEREICEAEGVEWQPYRPGLDAEDTGPPGTAAA